VTAVNREAGDPNFVACRCCCGSAS
jgi:hypothetical protein